MQVWCGVVGSGRPERARLGSCGTVFMAGLMFACGRASSSERPVPEASEAGAPNAPSAPQIPNMEAPPPQIPVDAPSSQTETNIDDTLCVDLSDVPVCRGDAARPRPPVVLLNAEELGPGFEFVSIHAEVALARSAERSVAVIVDPQLPNIARLELIADDGSRPEVVRDAFRGLDESGFSIFVIGCTGSSCELSRTTRSDPESGAPVGPLSLVTSLSPAWDARGVFQDWLFDTAGYDYCVYGRGIWCLGPGGAWDELLAAEHGPIRTVSNRFALTESGVLLEASTDAYDALVRPMQWTEVTTSAPLTRLNTAGAFNDAGLWVDTSSSRFTECTQQPPLVAGAFGFDAMDTSGNIYSRQSDALGVAVERCRWPDVIDSPVLGEAYLSCGIGQNWIVLVAESVLEMHGGFFCAID